MYAGFLFRCEKTAAWFNETRKVFLKKRWNCLGEIIDLLHCIIFLIFERGHQKKKKSTFSVYSLSSLHTETCMFLYLCVCVYAYFLGVSLLLSVAFFFLKILDQYDSFLPNPVEKELRKERRHSLREVTCDVNRRSALYRGDSQQQHKGKTLVQSSAKGREVWTVVARAGETGP